ncbi:MULTISPECIES: extracellular solute-binding protein [Micromonospora]|uniref:extracellular solute-binding protein n=1 Tax=Micromonospora TaxID=1873 RepID=UPI0011CD6876|nr:MULTISPECIES: extracellular solute-binding protein [Micromonospora]NES13772.1 extracellular solute-binding protein [Micromonospora sp. PPF5-17B]NES35563.1 extracellular solute-binding protein [Micromonospora solifontis]NES55951.1 extracellular solute-binding protein [Micromonospora sp. PPF5-6]
MATQYSRRSFLAGVVSTGLVSAGATFLLPGGRTRSDSLSGRPRLCTGTDLTGARAAVIGMWNEANPDAKVELDEVPGGSRAERDSMVERIKNGAVDIVNLDIVDVREFAKEGYIKEISLPTRTYFPAVERAHRVAAGSGRYWAVPFNSDVGMLFSRVTTGLDTRQPLLPQVIRRDTRGVARFVGQLLPDTENDTEPFVVNVLEHALSVDPGILDRDGRVAEDLVRWQDALSPLRTAIQHNDVVRARNEEETRDLFEAGLTHMRNWPARYRGLRSQVALLPLPSGILGGQSLALVANAANVDASLRFIEFATSAAAQRVAAAHGLAPALTHVYDDPSLLQAMPYLEAVKSALEQAIPRPTHRHYRDFAAAVRRHVLPFLGQPNGRLTSAFTDEIKSTLDPGTR